MKAKLESVARNWPTREIEVNTLEDLLEQVRMNRNGCIIAYDFDGDLVIKVHDGWYE